MTRELGSLVMAMDHLRRPAVPLPGLAAHKEWHHFLIEAPGLLLLVNVSLSEEATHQGERTIARLKVLARTTAWDGDIDVFEASSVRAQPGRIDLGFGPNQIRFDGERYVLSLALRERPIAVELALEPVTAPLLIRHVRLAAGKPLSWVMVPRLVATGTVTLGDRVHRIAGAPAYHDHNWGYFGWGDDFTWEWGTALPPPESRWSCAMVRTTDRARTRQGLRALYLWRDQRVARILRGDELTIRHEGATRQAAICKVPRVMALIEPGVATDVPARVVVEGHAPGVDVELAIETIDLAQILMPDEEGHASVTTLNQVYARVTLAGQLDGEPLALDAPGVFEFIRATTTPRPPPPLRAHIRVDAPVADGQGPMLPLVADSFRALAAERPGELAQLYDRLAGQTLALAIDGELLAVRFAQGTVELARDAGAATLHLALARQLIADVIRAEITLEQALATGRLHAAGSVGDLARLHEALLVYVHGAIRAPSFPGLWQRFREELRCG